MNIKYYLLLAALIFTQNSVASSALTLCIDGDCKTSQRIRLNDDNWNKVTEIFSVPAQTTQQEREFIIKALATIEKISLNELANITVESLSAEDLYEKMNNRDLALNHKAYISLLLDQILIQHHSLRKTEHRTSWLGQSEYAIVILDQKNSDLYAIDINNTDFSEPAPVQLLKKWKNKNSFSALKKKAVNKMFKQTQFKSNAE